MVRVGVGVETSASFDPARMQLADGSVRSASGGLLRAVDLPDGLTLNTTTGVISGTLAPGAAADGPFAVTVAVANGYSVADASFNFTVNPMIVVPSISDQATTEGATVSLQVTATDPSGTPTYSAEGLPAGVSMTTTGLITGTLTTGDAVSGPYYGIAVTVTDGTYSTEQDFNWSIAPASAPAAPTLSVTATQVNVPGDDVNVTVSATDTAGYTLTFSASGLPDGVDIDPDAGVISGTLAEDAVSSGSYPVTVFADDGVGDTASATFAWVVNAPAISLTGGSVGVTEGVDPGGVTLATFADTDPNADPTTFTANVNWGDGGMDMAQVVGSDGAFSVIDDHVYDMTGTYTISLSVMDGYGQTKSLTETATVAAASLTVTGGFQQGGIAGANVTGDWATFTDKNLAATSSSYTASITWGDGTSSPSGTPIICGHHAVRPRCPSSDRPLPAMLTCGKKTRTPNW